MSGNISITLPTLYDNFQTTVVIGVAISSAAQDKSVQAPHFLPPAVSALGHILDNHFKLA